MDLLIAGKILLFFSQRLMDLLKLIMYKPLTHSTAFLTSPHCKKLKEQILCSNYKFDLKSGCWGKLSGSQSEVSRGVEARESTV